MKYEQEEEAERIFDATEAEAEYQELLQEQRTAYQLSQLGIYERRQTVNLEVPF